MATPSIALDLPETSCAVTAGRVSRWPSLVGTNALVQVTPQYQGAINARAFAGGAGLLLDQARPCWYEFEQDIGAAPGDWTCFYTVRPVCPTNGYPIRAKSPSIYRAYLFEFDLGGNDRFAAALGGNGAAGSTTYDRMGYYDAVAGPDAASGWHFSDRMLPDEQVVALALGGGVGRFFVQGALIDRTHTYTQRPMMGVLDAGIISGVTGALGGFRRRLGTGANNLAGEHETCNVWLRNFYMYPGLMTDVEIGQTSAALVAAARIRAVPSSPSVTRYRATTRLTFGTGDANYTGGDVAEWGTLTGSAFSQATAANRPQHDLYGGHHCVAFHAGASLALPSEPPRKVIVGERTAAPGEWRAWLETGTGLSGATIRRAREVLLLSADFDRANVAAILAAAGVAVEAPLAALLSPVAVPSVSVVFTGR